MTRGKSPYLEGLNPEQHAAVTHGKGPILILAGAGSGKTRVLTHRIAHLVSHYKVPPFRILAVTFTNKAAGEMKDRLKGLLGDKAEKLWISTFHSACLRMLRRHAQLIGYESQFVVYDDDDTKVLIKSILKELEIDPKEHPVNTFKRAIERAKNARETSEDLVKKVDSVGASRSSGRTPWVLLQRMIAEVFDHYQRRLLEANAMDFTDLLVNSLRVLEEFPEVRAHYQDMLHFVLVDEFQDTNQLQYKWLRFLVGSRNNFLVVGDDDQSIYAFRGADVGNILSFERDFPDTKVVKLEQNYRSTQNILSIAHSIIKKNQGRKRKKLWTDGQAGELAEVYVAADESDEAQFIAESIERLANEGRSLSDFSCFYRTNAQSRALEEAFVRLGIPYRIFGGLKFFDRKEVKDILAYLRLLLNPADVVSFRRVVNTPPRGIGPQAVLKLAEYADENGCNLWQAAKDFRSEHKGIGQFVNLIEGCLKVAGTARLGELMDHIIENSGYIERLKQSKDVMVQSRLENIQELRNVAANSEIPGASALESGAAFLDRAALTASSDNPSQSSLETGSTEENGDKPDGEPQPMVSLMTLHLAKGLEFPVVFMTGMEEGLLPHYLTLQNPDEIEEERRLAYVGVTRAMELLYLTRAEQRGMFGAGGSSPLGGRFRVESRFLKDIPNELYEINLASVSDSDDYFAIDEDFGEFHEEYGSGVKVKEGESSYGSLDFFKNRGGMGLGGRESSDERRVRKQKAKEEKMKKLLQGIKTAEEL